MEDVKFYLKRMVYNKNNIFDSNFYIYLFCDWFYIVFSQGIYYIKHKNLRSKFDGIWN